MTSDHLNPADAHREIDALAASFLNAFCNCGGRGPRLEDLDALMLPGCVVVKRSEAGVEVMTLTEFAAPRQALLTDGTLTDFEEREEAARTFVFGGIASRTCTYRKSGSLHGRPFASRGVKGMHLVRTEQGWRISAVVWEDEREGLPASSARWADSGDA